MGGGLGLEGFRGSGFRGLKGFRGLGFRVQTPKYWSFPEEAHWASLEANRPEMAASSDRCTFRALPIGPQVVPFYGLY